MATNTVDPPYELNGSRRNHIASGIVINVTMTFSHHQLQQQKNTAPIEVEGIPTVLG